MVDGSPLPEVNQLVTVRDLAGKELPTRVEDVTSSTLVVPRPVDGESGIGLRPEGLTVMWPADRGVMSLPVKLNERRADNNLDVWELAFTGPATRQQRRAFVRVPVSAGVALTFLAERPIDPTPDTPAISGWLVDLSEAAACISVPTARYQDLKGNARLQATFTIGDDSYELPARVSSSAPVREVEDRTELVVHFEIPETEAARLRRMLFAQQVRLRDLNGR